MAGTYTEITITAPSSAQEGSAIDVVVAVKNIIDYTIYVIPVLDVNGSIAQGGYEAITPGETHSWAFSFIAPSADILLTVSSWLETYNVDWQKDYSVEYTISVTAVGAINLTDLVGMVAVVMMMSMMAKMMKGV